MAGIRLIGMGGTIAFATSSLGAIPALNAAELSRTLSGAADISAVDLAEISSIGITEVHLRLLVSEIVASLDGGYDGIVVSHGTDTMEESVYLVALTVARSEVPVVFTGAMRHHDAAGSDGAANLSDALSVARHGEAAGKLGPVLVMNGEVHTARFVAKTHTVGLGAFSSPDAGPVGAVTEGRVATWFAPTYEDYVGGLGAAPLPQVELVHMTTALDSAWLAGLPETRPNGVVLAGFGGGHAHTSALQTIDKLVAMGIPVISASRCGSGATLRSTYGVDGTEIDLQRRGVLMAGALSPVKARLRLAVAVANGLAASAVFPLGD